MLLRSFCSALIACLSLLPLSAQAQDTPPDYVIEQFGTPPSIPDGPLPEHIERAVRTVFIDGMQSTEWTREKQEALYEISQSCLLYTSPSPRDS